MYSYDYDVETGGIILNSSPLQFSKEPRPVYYKELDILGFDKYWVYDRNDAYPYMWAEANNYYYRGRKVAQTKGGSCYTAPEIIILEAPELDGVPLRFVDIPKMIEKNRELLEGLVQDTIKMVYNTYVKYKDKVDIFHVSYSGGKDSGDSSGDGGEEKTPFRRLRRGGGRKPYDRAVTAVFLRVSARKSA